MDVYVQMSVMSTQSCMNFDLVATVACLFAEFLTQFNCLKKNAITTELKYVFHRHFSVSALTRNDTPSAFKTTARSMVLLE